MSVVLACRNEMASLPACLDALLAQDHPEVELLLVDGRSTDGCTEFARSRGVRVLADQGLGPAAARNIGIAGAHGDVVAFTDADCIPHSDWLSRLSAHFEDPTVAGVAGGLRLPRATLLGRLEDNDARVHYRGYITSNVAYRRDVLLQVGGFDPTLRCAEDYDLAWRLLDAGHRIVRDPTATVIHGPPELADGLAPYLKKQFWYARKDIPTHSRAITRAWRAERLTTTTGSGAAAAGLLDALGLSALAIGTIAGIALRDPWIAGAAAGAALWTGTVHVTRTARQLGERPGERAKMALAETAKRVIRGAGTLVGLAELARGASWQPFTPDAVLASSPGPWAAPSAAPP